MSEGSLNASVGAGQACELLEEGLRLCESVTPAAQQASPPHLLPLQVGGPRLRRAPRITRKSRAQAYAHIAPVLGAIAEGLGKSRAALQVLRAVPARAPACGLAPPRLGGIPMARCGGAAAEGRNRKFS